MFVDGFLEVGELGEADRQNLDETLGSNTGDMAGMLDRIGSALSAATHGASVVLAPKREAPIKHIDFVPLSPDRALVVLVHADGHVENRLFQPPPGHTPSAMREAANYLNAHLAEKNAGQPARRDAARGGRPPRPDRRDREPPDRGRPCRVGRRR